jgi:hypothetical protein
MPEKHPHEQPSALQVTARALSTILGQHLQVKAIFVFVGTLEKA